MLLAPEDLDLFFRLHRTLMFFVNQRLRVLPDELATPEDFAALLPVPRLAVRDAFVANLDLIDAFATQNPGQFSEDELDIVRSWRHLVTGEFYVFRELKRYTVLLSSKDPVVAYGVLALSQPFEDLIGPYLPVLTKTVLLPFRDQIVYDGLLQSYNVSFGPGIRRSLNESFQEAKAGQGIVTALPMAPTSHAPARSRKARPRAKTRSKEADTDTVRGIIDMVDRFCREHLNEEYAELCRRLAEKLARKRPSPLLSGRPNTWACGIVRTIGWVNYLDDPSQEPHMKLTVIDITTA